MDLELAFRQFRQQRNNARRRKINFNLTFNEWVKIWTDSGKYELRGPGLDQYVMSRHGDQGAYEVGNVCIKLAEENRRESALRGNSGQFKLGHKLSDSCLANISTTAKARWAKYREETPGKYAGWKKEKKTCPHCGKLVAGQRWHFDHCRYKKLD